MASPETNQEIIKGLYNAVVNMDEEAAAELSHKVLQEGIDAYEAVTKGLTAAMDRVGELYIRKEYFVGELLLCADALYAGLDVLRPHIKVERTQAPKKIVIGVVEGDIHDIGKNLVKIMFDAAGWTVYDLGRDVRLERFVEEHQRTKCDIVALSALMSSSMLAMSKVIWMLKAQDPDAVVLVGSAPVTREIAKQYGADGYADNAVEAVEEANRLIARLSKRQQGRLL